MVIELSDFIVFYFSSDARETFLQVCVQKQNLFSANVKKEK